MVKKIINKKKLKLKILGDGNLKSKLTLIFQVAASNIFPLLLAYVIQVSKVLLELIFQENHFDTF